MSVEIAVTPTNARPSKRKRTSDASIGGLQCQVCHRSYERADHLNRHLDSREFRSPLAITQRNPNDAQTATRGRFIVRSALQRSTEGICYSGIKQLTQRMLKMGS